MRDKLCGQDLQKSGRHPNKRVRDILLETRIKTMRDKLCGQDLQYSGRQPNKRMRDMHPLRARITDYGKTASVNKIRRTRQWRPVVKKMI